MREQAGQVVMHDDRAADEMLNQDILLPGEARKRLTDLVSRAVRKFAGRGPLEVKLRVNGCYLRIIAFGFLTPLEQTLIRRGKNHELVHLIRQRLLEETQELWEEELRRDFDLVVHEAYSHTDIEQDRLTISARVSSSRDVDRLCSISQDSSK